MKIAGTDLETAIEKARQQLEAEENISPAFKSSMELILTMLTLLFHQLGLNSKNSSKSPSSDPNREKKKKEPSGKKPGGQPGRKGVALTKFDDPDIIKEITVDRSNLPKGNYRVIGYETRQVVDIDYRRVITEFRAEILQNEKGKQFKAEFPENVSKAIQYGDSVKAHVVYLSQYQLLPYERVQEHFTDQLGIPISPGSIFNFNQSVYEKLETFEAIVKLKLQSAEFMHADETGINIQGKRNWLHVTSTNKLTLLYPHQKRGQEAMTEMGVFPKYQGILCHDHWKPYYSLECKHALCNAHHLRELQRAIEQDKQGWAERLKALLIEIKKAVEGAGGSLSSERAMPFRLRYRDILKEGEIECPIKTVRPKYQTKGKIPQSKARNLLDRLINHEDDVLRFMEDRRVSFTNNQGERDLRMTKVQQKISGSFRSMDGAKIFCRVRSYLSTCQKNQMTSSEGLRLLFEGKLPDFLNNI